MKATISDVLKALPDADDLMKLAKDISILLYRRLSLESKIRTAESEVFQRAYTDKDLFQGNKPPSATFIDNTYKYTGFDGSLLPLREELTKVTADLEEKKLQMDVYKWMMEIWRTLSANSRNTSL